MPPRGPIVAAGAVVLRRRRRRAQVLLVHRPKYDDWSFPKGKLDRGESARTAAVREVAEETGADIRLGPRLSDQTYTLNGNGRGSKLVHYWVGRLRADHDAAAYEPNHEIDEVRWLDVTDARDLLSYDRDRAILNEALPFESTSHPLVVLRHAEARSRRRWKGDDRERTLTKLGHGQAAKLVPLLAAYGVERLVSSSSRRCWTTLAPYGIAENLDIEVTDHLSEEDATRSRVTDEIDWLLGNKQAQAVCSHRPVLPLLFEALGQQPEPLAPAGAVIVHHRKGVVVALERPDHG